MKFSHLVKQEQLYYTFQLDSLKRTYVYSGDFDLIYKWKISFYDTGQIRGNLFGVATNFYDYAFGLGMNNSVVFTVWRTLAAGFGLVSEHGEGDQKLLIGAYINGKTFGDLSLAVANASVRAPAPHYPALFPNYPNPFHHTTRIGYHVPAFWTNPIRLAVFDLTGREVAILQPESPGHGYREVLWDGKDKQGRETSNGVYLIKLTSGQFAQTIKINYRR